MELNDLQFQRQGIASRLMDRAEQLITTRFRKAGITVGLLDAYGPAQRLYARRGYVPDGRSACQGQRPLKQGETVTVDHDLILWLTKDLGYFHDTQRRNVALLKSVLTMVSPTVYVKALVFRWF